MDSLRHLMLSSDSARRTDMVTDVALGLLATDGVRAVTPRAIGDRLGCSRQAVHQWFGSQESLQHVVATTFVSRWRRWMGARVRCEGLAGLLPVGGEGDEVVAWCRARLALMEHGPRDPVIADLVQVSRCDELEEVAGHLGSDPESDRVALIHHVVEGLRLGLCAAVPTLTPLRAIRMLHAAELLPFSLLDVKQGDGDASCQT